MTLNDLEILNDHFTLNSHYYEQRFQQLGYTLTHVRCAEAESAEYLKSATNDNRK